MTNNDMLIDFIEKKVSVLPIEGGEITLFEMNSEMDTYSNLMFFKDYIENNGYDVNIDNSDVYRLLFLSPKKG